MKPSFHARLLNSPFEDPGLYVRVLREGRALLFDAGSTSALSVRDILKISDIFISHTHVDHFIGLDSILRLHLKREKPLRLYGPEGIIRNIEGKLHSYTWNLIGEYPLVIDVSEIGEKTIGRAVFKAGNSFRREDKEIIPYNGIIMTDSFVKVSATVLDHQIPCLAFCLEEDYHININKARLKDMNLPVGPWLDEFKKAIRQKKSDSVYIIEGREYAFEEIIVIADITKGQKISYVVDIVGSGENMRKIIELARCSDVLYSEAYFLHDDIDMAKERYHLTAKQAGMIAREAGAGRLEVFHFSPRYMDSPEKLTQEAEREFKRGGY